MTERNYCMINRSVPKLDCECRLSFLEGMRRLGVTDVFQAGDFTLSPQVQSQTPIYASDMKQSARLIMDEEGIEAASIIAMPLFGAMPPEEEIDFTLDRPFLMAIIGESDVPLFIGVINNPAE